MAKRSAPEVNAGSMADIAFLLLIFFLVTPIEEIIDPPIIKQKNIFTVVVNKNNQLLVEEELTDISDVRTLAMKFLDNGGGTGEDSCDYCQGKKASSSSDNPEKAVISLKNDRETSYKVYIAVQNELVAAYNELRNREYLRLNPMNGMNFVQANSRYSDPRTSIDEKEKLKPQLNIVKSMYPQKLSEAEPNKN